MKRTNQILAVFLAVILMAGCFGFSGVKANAAGLGNINVSAKSDTPVLPAELDEITYTLMFGEHATELYHEDTWVLAPWAKEKFNINLDITAVPASDWNTKLATVIASQEIPDCFMGISRDIANQYGPLGLFLNLYDYIDQMPNLQACAERFPDLNTWMYYSPNEIYSQPTTIATDGAVNMTAYYIMFMRRDIMNELGIADMPTTFDELHDVFAAMKAAYPESTPWINRQTFDMILNVFSPGLGINVAPMSCSHTGYAVWNEEEGQFTSLMDEENFKWFLGWMKQCYDEGLLDPNYAATDTSTWQDKLDNSEGFFSVDYFSRPDTMTGSGSKITEGFLLEAFQTPALEDGVQKVYSNSGVTAGNVYSGKAEQPERLVQLIDNWFYTEEGCLLTTYGIEGQTYTKNEDGTLGKIYTDEVATSLDFDAAYGVNYLTFYSFKPDFFGYDLYDVNQSPVYNATWNLFKDGMTSKPPTILFNAERTEEYNEYNQDLLTTERNIFNEFVIGRRDIEKDWDAAIDELDAAGYFDFIDLLNEQLND